MGSSCSGVSGNPSRAPAEAEVVGGSGSGGSVPAALPASHQAPKGSRLLDGVRAFGTNLARKDGGYQSEQYRSSVQAEDGVRSAYVRGWSENYSNQVAWGEEGDRAKRSSLPSVGGTVLR